MTVKNPQDPQDPSHQGASRRDFIRVTGTAVAAGSMAFGLPSAAAATASHAAAPGTLHRDVRRLIERGSIVNRAYTAQAAVGRYQGNGRFGAVYSKLGLHPHPSQRDEYAKHGHSQFMHMKHWGRFFFRSEYQQADTSADYLLPLARAYWQDLPQQVSQYTQQQSFYDGTISTRFTTGAGARVGVTTWFDAVERNLSVIEIDLDRGKDAQAGAMPLIVAPVTSMVPYQFGYKEPTAQRFKVQRAGDQWRIDITCAATKPATVSSLYLKTDAAVEAHADGVRIVPRQGRSLVLLSYGEPVSSTAAADSLKRTRDYWRRTWEQSALFDFPDARAQETWVRSLAYILSTFNDDGYGFTPTNGLTGNLYMFNYAQDLFYVHPTLLASGNLAPAKAWIERFAGMIPEMRAYSKRLWPTTEGIYPPWELPFGPVDTYHNPSVPIVYCYEPHNAGYLSRMAHDTALALGDPAWTAAYARPLIGEVAQYFKSFCKKEADGRWHLFLTPSVGQDEAGGRNQKDYLCSLYSAKYSFQKAIEHGFDSDGKYARILKDGLAFEGLLSDKGFYYASAGSGPKDYGTQKHPVQLNGLAYLAVEPRPIKPELTAFRQRYASTDRANEPYFFGWTLGEFLLAGTHAGDVAAWRKDWDNVRRSDYTDPEWVQIYETSARPDSAFYVTTSGLIAQSLVENIVSDYWGELRIAACNPYGEAVRFANVRSVLGVHVSGTVRGAAGEVQLTAWKDCSIKLNGLAIALKKGQTRKLALPPTRAA